MRGVSFAGTAMSIFSFRTMYVSAIARQNVPISFRILRFP
jgi:hypothetical protein